jgi:hypothetical protein
LVRPQVDLGGGFSSHFRISGARTSNILHR